MSSYGGFPQPQAAHFAIPHLLAMIGAIHQMFGQHNYDYDSKNPWGHDIPKWYGNLGFDGGPVHQGSGGKFLGPPVQQPGGPAFLGPPVQQGAPGPVGPPVHQPPPNFLGPPVRPPGQ